MATKAQIEANRRNAAKSTGPRTRKGKQNISRNAVKHGLLSSDVLLLREDANTFREFSEGVHNEHAPETPTEASVVRQIVSCLWRLERIPTIEAGRQLWIEYATSSELIYSYDDQRFRQKVREALAARHSSAGEPDEALSGEMLIARANALADNAVAAVAWRSDSSPLWRYESKLHRRLEKLLTLLDCHKRRRQKNCQTKPIGCDPAER